MEFKSVNKKSKNRSFVERAHYIPETYKFIESFLDSRTKAYESLA